MPSIPTALSALKTILDLRRYTQTASVTLDLGVLHQEEDDDGTVHAALLASLWNTGSNPAENGYIHFWPQNWTFHSVKPQESINLHQSHISADLLTVDNDVRGFYTEFPDKPVFPDTTNRVGIIIASFNPDKEYLLGYEAGCTAHNLRPGAYLLWVDDGELQLMRRDWTRWFAVKQRLSTVTERAPVVGSLAR